MRRLLQDILYPAWHWARRDGVNQARAELERSQWLSLSQLHELQQRKLASLLSVASRNVPYYRKLLLESGLLERGTPAAEAFRRVPLLTKSIIRREQDALVSENLTGNKLRANSTSGSTGEMVRFYTDSKSTAYRKAAEIRSDSWTGWQLGDRMIKLWGAPMDQKLATSVRGRLHGWVTGNRFLSSYDLSESTMDRYIEIIRDFNPVLLVAYPGPLEQLAVHCGKRGVRFASLKGIVSSAETLWPHQREAVEGALGVKVFNRYGCREFGQIASECETHDGLHVSMDRHLIEVVDDEGQACAPGEMGRILATDLDNVGMPLLRYDIGDMGVWAKPRTCRCGRELPRLERIEGRTMEIVRTPDGRRIGGTFWTLLLRSRPGLKQIQLIQERPDGIIINFVRDTEFDSNVLAYFTSRIQEYCGADFKVEFVERDSIELTVSGKRRFIVSRLEDEHRSTKS